MAQKSKKEQFTYKGEKTPVTVLWDGILMLPVVGIVDSNRAQEMMETMLKKILDTEAKVIILDILGVAAMDSAVANQIYKNLQSHSDDGVCLHHHGDFSRHRSNIGSPGNRFG